MPKSKQYTELNAVLYAIYQYPDGLSLEKIRQLLLDRKLSRRTLQRRLAYLVATGQLQMTGSRKGARYRAGGVAEQAAPYQKSSADIPLFYQSASAESKEIKRYLQQPLTDRNPTVYKREFLDHYQPNQTAYLPEHLRKHLWQLGKPFPLIRPAGTYARQILQRLLIDLSWNSSRLEGNTYSLLETDRLLSAGSIAVSKSLIETQMILNHKNAIEFLVEAADEIAFNSYTIFNLHALLADNILRNPKACGCLREIPVAIHGTAFRPTTVLPVLTECFQQILEKAAAIQDPFEQAFFTMVHLPYLQPFEDVNKRVSRLAANIPLIKHNLCPLSFVDVADRDYIEALLGVYELNRIELLRDLFVFAYERSALHYSTVRHEIGEPDPFRMRYRARLQETVGAVVKKIMDKKTAAAFIHQQALISIPIEERARYIEIVETELLALHPGNIARYRLRPHEFEVWYKSWY